MARWCSGFLQDSTPRVTRFDSQQSTFFLGGDGYILFYFETWIADSFAYYLFSFYLFSMKFMYNLNRTSSDGRIASAHHFLTDCWATLTSKDKQFILIICNNGTQPRRGVGRFSRVLDFSSSPQCRGNTRGLSDIGKHGSHI